MGWDYIAHLCLDIKMKDGYIGRGYYIQTKGFYYCGDELEKYYMTPHIKPIKIYDNGIFCKELYENEIKRVNKEHNFDWDLSHPISNINDIMEFSEYGINIDQIKTITFYDTRIMN